MTNYSCFKCGNNQNLQPAKFDTNYQIIYLCFDCLNRPNYNPHKKAQLHTSRKAKKLPSYLTECKIREELRDAIHYCLKNKKHKYDFTLGCDSEMLRRHLESQFLPFMSWDNKCLWNIHHIRPLSTFSFILPNGEYDTEAMKKANHYTNLQPVWINEHRKIETKTKQAYNRTYEI